MEKGRSRCCGDRRVCGVEEAFRKNRRARHKWPLGAGWGGGLFELMSRLTEDGRRGREWMVWQSGCLRRLSPIASPHSTLCPDFWVVECSVVTQPQNCASAESWPSLGRLPHLPSRSALRVRASTSGTPSAVQRGARVSTLSCGRERRETATTRTYSVAGKTSAARVLYCTYDDRVYIQRQGSCSFLHTHTLIATQDLRSTCTYCTYRKGSHLH